MQNIFLTFLCACAFFTSGALAQQGRDGNVKLLYSQAISTMNPYLTGGAKDIEASSLVLEPLAGFDDKGNMFPRLASSIPSIENGGISGDYTSITWKLKPGIKWSDGSDFTADDVVFTAQYCLNPEGGCAQAGRFNGIENVEKLDDLTVKVTFEQPQYNPFTSFVGSTSPILQKAQFENCLGTTAPTCTNSNFKPNGTGPFRVVNFKVNDSIELEANPYYRDTNKPAFATVSIKGGGDAASAARAVMETSEIDYAWNTQINPELQAYMSSKGQGQFVSAFGSFVERLEVNLTNPSAKLPEGERSTAAHPHPYLSDQRVREALSKAIDRNTLAAIGYGKAGRPICSLIPAPEIYASTDTTCLTQDIEGAKKLLDEAGWVVGTGGIREKDGQQLSIVYQTSVNPVRQDFQALIKAWWEQIGVKVELKSIDPGVYFGGDPGSPDTYQKFYADIEMYANSFEGTDPEYYLAERTCDKAPRPENQWNAPNINRFCDQSYDSLVKKLANTRNLNERSEIVKKLNNMLTKDSYVILPLVDRGHISAHSNTLSGVVMNVWDSELWNVEDWYRVK